MLVNVLCAIIILLLISFSDLPSSVIKLPRYTYDVTCSICCPSMAIFILGEFGFVLTTIALVFLILIFIPNCFPTCLFCLLSLIVPFQPVIPTIIDKFQCITDPSVVAAKRSADSNNTSKAARNKQTDIWRESATKNPNDVNTSAIYYPHPAVIHVCALVLKVRLLQSSKRYLDTNKINKYRNIWNELHVYKL